MAISQGYSDHTNIQVKVWHIERDSVPVDNRKFSFLVAILYCQMTPNILDKKTLQSKIEQLFLGRSTGLQGWKWITVHQI